MCFLHCCIPVGPHLQLCGQEAGQGVGLKRKAGPGEAPVGSWAVLEPVGLKGRAGCTGERVAGCWAH